MPRITLHAAIVALVALAAPFGGQAPAAPGPGPQPTLKEIATISGVEVEEAVRMPNGRVVLYTTGDRIFVYDLASKRSTLVTRGFDGELAMSRAGDRIAYDHLSEDGKINVIWSIPMNPATGAAAGPAQRVSMREGVESSFSPDGKFIAFEAHERPDAKTNRHFLAVVPATGGPERLLAEYDNVADTCWSADGKWVYALLGDRNRIERVPVAGGPPEPVVLKPGSVDAAVEGCAFFRVPSVGAQREGRAAYTTTAGSSGEFRIPLGSFPGKRTDATGRSLVRETTESTTARVLSLADGRVRDLVTGTVQSQFPAWSADGRRLAVQVSTGGSFQIVVMNSDGTQQRRYPVTKEPTLSLLYMQWSPDGQRLAYYRNGRAGAIDVLELATGNVRPISLSPRVAALFMWRPDSQSIVALKQVFPSGESGPSHQAVYDVRLDGTERLLRDLGAEFPGYMLGTTRPGVRGFITDRLLLAVNGTDRFVVPTGDGPQQKIIGGTNGHLRYRSAVSGSSADEKWLVHLLRDAGQPVTSVEVTTVTGESARTIKLPFVVASTVYPDAVVPGGQSLVLTGRVPGENANKIFLIPMNGGAPRVLAQFSEQVIGMLDMSPDGKHVTYTVEGPPMSKIYELDMNPILNAGRTR